ncbi:DUF2461 domain-containing protein [Conexibacter sp. JD483]|uniref:DUF2461 domain-containing protein n=1 Tax=unclassified Conexibacter TaxID=2627773 RepID=UPI00271D6C77|nr:MULTISPECIES: DUF2461 domain-containing protein [unclassified Conexibacter]MDO8186625.1 DUF2461 domain-containing protein [Conexibacter sp. CPCC 205706]MDO8196730.1 DUF2461 domain-containing protein [Conexibacter sp. CPCC 205762]MDR9370903.1 DUF2461 domain-containing protein [Conexibacter sp. JD483]
MTRFRGFRSQAFAWFEELADHNERDWFQANKATYETQVRGPLESLLEQRAERDGGVAKLARQNRDTRFSHDKSPYKTRTYGAVVERPGSNAGLYAEISADGLFAGGGYYVLLGDQLERYRAAVLSEKSGPALVEAVAQVEAAGVEVFGETLKRAPRGIDPHHPRVRLLRHKMLIAGDRLAPKETGITAKAGLRHVERVWGALEPMNAWLDRHVGASREAPPGRPGR